MAKTKGNNLSDIQTAINKLHGDNALITLDNMDYDTPKIPTGILSLDNALRGGLPKGKMALAYGKEGCLAGDTFIPFHTVYRDGRQSNSKGGSIAKLYRKFNRLEEYSDFNLDVVFVVGCVNDENGMERREIKDVVYSGIKPVYAVTTQTGHRIEATLDHKFRTNEEVFLPLSELSVGDFVQIHNNTRFKKDPDDLAKNNRIERKYFYVKSHPVARVKLVEGKYRYHALLRSHAVIEAEMNELGLDEFIDRLNASDLEDLHFLDPALEVHHIDENVLNDSLENLQVISKPDHAREHALERHNNLRFTPANTEIISIEYIGEVETYDICMDDPYHNFVANNFIVHNSGKSAIATMFAAQAQKEGKVVYIDLENALDPHKAKNSGIIMDELFISQPGSAEETLEIIEMCLGADDVSAIIVDSVAAMATEAEINGDYSDAHVGVLARLLSQGLRKINQFMLEKDSDTILFFVNQIRMIIGGYGNGPQTTTPGGKALPFYSATTMDVARISNLKQGEDIIGQTSQVTLKKSKFAPPFQKAAFDIYFESGISNESSIIDLAVKFGRIDKGGGGWMADTITGEKLGQGKPNVIKYLEGNPEYAQELTDFVLENI